MPENALDTAEQEQVRALDEPGDLPDAAIDDAASDDDATGAVATEAAAHEDGPTDMDLDASTKGTESGSTPAVAEDGASLETDQVEMRLSGIGRVDASIVNVDVGAVGAARADSISVERGAIGAAMAGTVEVSRGYARSILARQVQLDRSAARIVIAADVQAKQSAVMFLVARRVEGEMRVLFDWRGALAFGAAAGLVIALLSRLRRR